MCMGGGSLLKGEQGVIQGGRGISYGPTMYMHCLWSHYVHALPMAPLCTRTAYGPTMYTHCPLCTRTAYGPTMYTHCLWSHYVHALPMAPLCTRTAYGPTMYTHCLWPHCVHALPMAPLCTRTAYGPTVYTHCLWPHCVHALPMAPLCTRTAYGPTVYTHSLWPHCVHALPMAPLCTRTAYGPTVYTHCLWSHYGPTVSSALQFSFSSQQLSRRRTMCPSLLSRDTTSHQSWSEAPPPTTSSLTLSSLKSSTKSVSFAPRSCDESFKVHFTPTRFMKFLNEQEVRGGMFSYFTLITLYLSMCNVV